MHHYKGLHILIAEGIIPSNNPRISFPSLSLCWEIKGGSKAVHTLTTDNNSFYKFSLFFSLPHENLNHKLVLFPNIASIHLVS